jgi:hypothetical protein
MDQMSYRAKFFFQMPTPLGTDPHDPQPKVELGEFFPLHEEAWAALEEARSRREPIAKAMIQAFDLPYVRLDEIEIHLCKWNAQLNLFGEPIKIIGGKPKEIVQS